METFFQYLLYFLTILSFVVAIHYMMKAKRTQEQKSRGLYTARMNMSMGVLLISAGSIQLFLFVELSTIRLIVGGIFLAIGVLNLYGGFRNHAFFKKN